MTPIYRRAAFPLQENKPIGRASSVLDISFCFCARRVIQGHTWPVAGLARDHAHFLLHKTAQCTLLSMCMETFLAACGLHLNSLNLCRSAGYGIIISSFEGRAWVQIRPWVDLLLVVSYSKVILQAVIASVVSIMHVG